MFAYNLSEGLPAGSRTVWSQLSLQPLTAQPLSPFSYSILDEVTKSAWYHYYDELGFAPMPRSRLLRQAQGRAYLNLTLFAQRDAALAAVAPLTLQLNGQPFAITKWEKPGLLAGMKAGRNRKKIEQLLETYRQQLPAITQKAESWYRKTQELRWSQADILQVMEEVERVSIESFKVFLAARHNLELLYNGLLWSTHANVPFPQNLALIHQALGDLSELSEYRMAEQVMTLGALAATDRATVAWLSDNHYENWQTTLPNQALVAAVTTFLAHYGHRCANEGEVNHDRWQQDPTPLFASLAAYVQQKPALPPKRMAEPQPLLAAVAADQRKQLQQQLQQIRQLLLLQSQALHAFAYILAGTRQWALAAAKEALTDHRLQQVEDVFFFQLEEVKQMMTGEWNISARTEIQATCSQRKTEVARWQQEAPPTLWIGDSPAYPTQQGLPGASGQTTGPYYHGDNFLPRQCAGAIIGAQHLDSGWALVLPVARAFVTAQGTPLDPMIAAAYAWHVPTVLALGGAYHHLVEGVQTTVYGERGQVTQ